MIDVQLLRYPEQLAAKLSDMEREIATLKRQVEQLRRGK